MKNSLKLFIWNIDNPSLSRATQQFNFFSTCTSDIFILTETKDSLGCNYIKDFFIQNRFFVDYKITSDKFDYGVIVASKIKFSNSSFIDTCTFLPNRISSISKVKFTKQSLYIPSRNPSKEKIIRKQKFIEQITSSLNINKDSNINRIICGDFNVLERFHIPHYNNFKQWEYKFYDDILELNYIDCFKFKNTNILDYSWFGHTGNGYRYDYAFSDKNLSPNISNCFLLILLDLLN